MVCICRTVNRDRHEEDLSKATSGCLFTVKLSFYKMGENHQKTDEFLDHIWKKSNLIRFNI